MIDEVEEKTFYSVEDSKIISKYDKNKDGIINKFEAEDIKKKLEAAGAKVTLKGL